MKNITDKSEIQYKSLLTESLKKLQQEKNLSAPKIEEKPEVLLPKDLVEISKSLEKKMQSYGNIQKNVSPSLNGFKYPNISFNGKVEFSD